MIARDAVARVAGFDQFLELVGGRRGEHVARGRPVEHAVADVARVGRLVPAPAARHERDLPRYRCVVPNDDLRVGEPSEPVRVRRGHPVEHLVDDVVRIVDQLLHNHRQ